MCLKEKKLKSKLNLYSRRISKNTIKNKPLASLQAGGADGSGILEEFLKNSERIPKLSCLSCQNSLNTENSEFFRRILETDSS